MAINIKQELETEFTIEFNPNGSIGKRYLESSTVGIPFVVTVDHKSLEKQDVTIRDRDTEKQIRVNISELANTLHDLLKGKHSI